MFSPVSFSTCGPQQLSATRAVAAWLDVLGKVSIVSPDDLSLVVTPTQLLPLLLNLAFDKQHQAARRSAGTGQAS